MTGAGVGYANATSRRVSPNRPLRQGTQHLGASQRRHLLRLSQLPGGGGTCSPGHRSGQALGLQQGGGQRLAGGGRLAVSCLTPLPRLPLSLPGFLRLDGAEVTSGFLFLCSSRLA